MLNRAKRTKALRPVTVKPPHYVLDDQIGFLLRVAMQRHTAIFMSQMTCKLTQTQFAALAKLREVGPCSQNQLGRLIYLDAATIKGVVDRLKLRKLVTTQADPDDRRRRAITLTGHGLAITEAAVDLASGISAKTLTPLTTEEQRAIVRLIKKLT